MNTALLAVDFGDRVDQAFDDLTVFVPKFIGFLVILVLGYFVAKAVARIVDAVLERVGFDRAVERGGIRKALSNSRYDASDIIGKVVFYALFLLVLQLAFGVFGPNAVSDLIAGVIAYLPKVVVAIILIVVAAAVAAAAKTLIEESMGGLSYGRALANVASASILVVGVFAALNQLRIAPEIVTGLFYALLAVIVGSAIIAIGGGGIQPMRTRWERALNRIEEEAPQARAQLEARRRAAVAPPPPPPPEPEPVAEPVPAPEYEPAPAVAEVEHLELADDEPAPPPVTAPVRRTGTRREPLRPRGGGVRR